LRIVEYDGFDAEAPTEINCGLVERLAGRHDPQIKLIARLVASETPEEMPRDVNREAPFSSRTVTAERASATPLLATASYRFAVK